MAAPLLAPMVAGLLLLTCFHYSAASGRSYDSSIIKSRKFLITASPAPPKSPYLTFMSSHVGFAFCLGPEGDSTAADTQIFMHHCIAAHASDAQMWLFDPVSGHVVSKASGLCLSARGTPPMPGTRLLQDACIEGAFQSWANEGLTWSLKVSEGVRLCLGAMGPDWVPRLWECDGSPSQAWLT